MVGTGAGTAWCGPTCRQRASSGGFNFAVPPQWSARHPVGTRWLPWGREALSLLWSRGREGLVRCGQVCSSRASHVQQMLISWSQPGYRHAVLLPEEMGAFLAFLSLARARREPLGDVLGDCLSFRPSTLPMPFLVSIQNHQLPEGSKCRWDPGAAPAGHCTAVPCPGRGCPFHGWSGRCQDTRLDNVLVGEEKRT